MEEDGEILTAEPKNHSEGHAYKKYASTNRAP